MTDLDLNDDPLKHISRPPLPWQSYLLTECGRPVVEFAEGIVISRVEAKPIVQRLGLKRSHFVFCVTCLNQANYNVDSWDADPLRVMARHVESGRHTRNRERRDPIIDELRALALLVEAHREEFDATVESLRSVDSLKDRRAARKAATRRA